MKLHSWKEIDYANPHHVSWWSILGIYPFGYPRWVVIQGVIFDFTSSRQAWLIKQTYNHIWLFWPNQKLILSTILRILHAYTHDMQILISFHLECLDFIHFSWFCHDYKFFLCVHTIEISSFPKCPKRVVRTYNWIHARDLDI